MVSIAIFISAVYGGTTLFLLFQSVTRFVSLDDPAPSLIAGEILKLVVAVSLTGYVSESYKLDLSTFGFSSGLSYKPILLSAFAGVTLCLVELLILTMHNWPSVFFAPKIDGPSLANSTPSSVLALLLLASLQEEVFFRGLLYSVLKQSFSVRSAILISAGFFGIMHLEIIRIISAFLIGCLFAVLREKYSSLIPPLIAHSLLNFTVFALVLLRSLHH